MFARPTDSRDAGFSLIELLVVIIVLPMIMGVLALAIGTTYKAQTMISAHLADAGDILSTQITFDDDVQSALLLTTDPSAPQCGAGTPILGLEWNPTTGSSPTYQSVASYVEVTTNGLTSLVRNLCTSGISTTPNSTTVMVQNLATSGTSVTLTPSTLQANAASGWIGAQSITNVAVAITQPHGSFIVASSPEVNLSLGAP